MHDTLKTVGTMRPQDHTAQFDAALRLAASRAKAAFPQEHARIAKGLELALGDHVTDMTRVKPGWWQVQSAQPTQAPYDVISNGHIMCTCPDHTYRNVPICKHGFAVLLVRSARTDMTSPKLRRAYHLTRGEEGHCRFLPHDKAMFFPGGHRRGVLCDVADLTVGAYVHA